MFHFQKQSNISLEWGLHGIAALAPFCEAIVIIDVLSFSTCVDICLAKGATVYPYAWNNENAQDFAARQGAMLAVKRSNSPGKFSLSPSSLLAAHEGLHLVLPSPNGSSLTLEAAGYAPTFAGCLRNAKALGEHLKSRYRKIAVIPCGERWEDDSLRPAIEDFIGAGAIISELDGSKSSEASLAEKTFRSCTDLYSAIAGCSSGIELHERGFDQDLRLACELNASLSVPVFSEDRYINIGRKSEVR